MYNESGRAESGDSDIGPVDLQRQARITIYPQYKQDNEVNATDKPNYNQSPLQLFSAAGRDDTIWRGLYLNIDCSPNTTGSQQIIYIPFIVKYTIHFSGRRWLPQVSSVDGGSSRLTRATYWALTSWDSDLTMERLLSNLVLMGPLVVSILGSQTHMCQSNQGPHRHWLVKMSRQIRKMQFPLAIRQTCWVSPVTATGKDTLGDTLRKYILYIKGKGAATVERGVPFLVKSEKNQRTKNEEILEMVLQKKRCSEICLKYPQLMQSVYKLARFRPQRNFRTHLVYYYGPPGTEKSQVMRDYY